MCGRLVSLISPELLSVIYGTRTPLVSSTPRYNITPGQPVLIVREMPTDGRELGQAVWGLIPSWAKDASIGHRLINARSETVAEKPSFRSAYRHRRCIIPASGFYEWQQQGTAKQPWYISSGVADHPLSLAGLWEQWQAPGGKSVESCTIITTTANGLMQPIHERMPVILSQDNVSHWLSSATSADVLRDLLIPCPVEILISHPVSPRVNNPRNDSPENILAVQNSR